MYDHQKVFEVEHKGHVVGWIVLDSLAHNLTFGGCRIIPDLTCDEVRELANTMTKKLIVHGLPTGGAKGGVVANAGGLPLDEILFAFGAGLRGVLDTHVVIGKDLGATDHKIDMIYKGVGSHQLTPVQKSFPDIDVPTSIADLDGYIPNMTALGVLYSALAAANRDDLDGVRVCIQGAGAVGKGAALRFMETGASIVAISDINQAVVSEGKGFTAEDIEAGLEGGNIDASRLQNSKVIGRDELFAVDCDLMILAAGSNTVDEKLADGIQASQLVEGSNFGLTLPARDVLARKGTLVVPDIVASSSSAAMVCRQLGAGNQANSDELWRDIQHGIHESTRECIRLSQQHKCTIREAFNDAFLPERRQKISYKNGVDCSFEADSKNS
ncbi:MAG: Glu/Leu/Phe/Val dehydrogenase [Bdellovibrionales bacterium]|nr:Glu/Leu/Phe/Val dehydrogenase [Bdellovibrionales bacterium]